MLDWTPQPPYTVEQLLQVIRILRDPENGCPWDKVQTHASIRKNFLEETCEALEAIDADDAVLLREELGDVLMQVVFHAAIEEERGRFTFEDVCRNVCEKLVFRHPNIFASSAAENAGINGWDALKNKEKGRTTLADELATVPATLPALMRAQKLQKRAAGHGLGQQDAAAAQHRLEAAVQDFATADAAAKQEAAGRLLFAAVNAARLAGVDAEEALTFASKRFTQQCLEQEQSGIQVEGPAPIERENSRQNQMEANNMTKTDLIAQVAANTEMSKKSAEQAVSAVFEALGKAMTEGEKITISGFGTFEVRERAERQGINPRTREPITIAASRSIVFKPGKSLKDTL